MFNLNESDRFLLFTRAVDLRKGVNPLSILVRSNSLCPTRRKCVCFPEPLPYPHEAASLGAWWVCDILQAHGARSHKPHSVP